MPTVIQDRTRAAGAADTNHEDVLVEFEKLMGSLGGGLIEMVHKLIDLAKTNPLWGGILGIIVIDILGHYGSHNEVINTDTNSVVNFWDWVTGRGPANFKIAKFPGVITQTAVNQIALIILTSYGITEAGSIIADLTKISNFAGSQPTVNLVLPSVTTLYEAGSGAVKVTEK